MNTDFIANDFLEHYGVLGMKWGVRKKPEKNSNGWKETKTNNINSREYDYTHVNPYFNAPIETNSKGEVTFENLMCPPYRINCSKCSITYDLRRRGYDVQAKPVYVDDLLKSDSRGGWLQPEYKVNLYRNKETGKKPEIHYYSMHDFSTYDYKESEDISLMSEEERKKIFEKLSNELISYGEGARGVFDYIACNDGPGHSVNWEVINGEVMIIDSQVDQIMSLEETMSVVAVYCYYRTDNCNITGNFDEYVEPYGLPIDKERTKRKTPNRRRSIKLEEMGEEGHAIK